MSVRTIVFTGLAGVVLAGVTVLQARNAGGPTAPLGAGQASPANDAPGVAAEGRVVTYPGAEVQVAAERTGRLVRVAVVEGQKVKKGDLLAEIDADELRAALLAARARVSEAEAEIRLAEANLGRRRQLVGEEVLAAYDLDQANRDIEIARARRETAAAETQRLEAQLRKSYILAPVSGTVTTRKVDAGETVEPGDAIATVADLSRLRIDAEADEADSAALRLGDEVAVSSEGYPGKAWRGRVEEIADSVTIRKLKPQDPGRPTDTRVLSVKVAFAEAVPLRLGTTVELKIKAKGR
jgi:RND family efflux transporter MFP subunit